MPRVIVCTTVYPLADVVREIGADDVRVDWILDLGDPLTGFTATSGDRERLITVDLMVCEGTRSDTWATQAITTMHGTDRFVALEQLPIVRTTPPVGYLWMDPAVIRELAPVLVDRLGTRLPVKRDVFQQRAQVMVERINAILRAHPDSVFGREEVIVLENGFNPLLDRFGVVARPVEANAYNLTDDDVRRIRRTADERRVKAILLPYDLPGGAVRDIEQRTGLRAYLIDKLGAPRYSGHSTFIEILEYNLSQLIAATHGKPAPSL